MAEEECDTPPTNAVISFATHRLQNLDSAMPLWFGSRSAFMRVLLPSPHSPTTNNSNQIWADPTCPRADPTVPNGTPAIPLGKSFHSVANTNIHVALEDLGAALVAWTHLEVPMLWFLCFPLAPMLQIRSKSSAENSASLYTQRAGPCIEAMPGQSKERCGE